MKKNKYKKNKFLRFTGIGVQMLITIWLGNEVGKWVDCKTNNDSGFYSKIITLIAIFISIYSVIKGVTKISKND